MRTLRYLLTCLSLIAGLMLPGCANEQPAAPVQPTVRKDIVRFGMLPYGDHTYAIIGVKKGWFDEANIDLRYSAIKVEEIVPRLTSGSMEVVSTPPGILMSSWDTAPNVRTFVFGDLFQGYAIMAQPRSTTYASLTASGVPRAEAIKRVIGQMKGKRFAYPTETAIKPFIDLVLSKGGLQRKDVKAVVLDDPLTVNAMRAKNADFQVGGVPSRIVLEREGFVPIITARDLAESALPSADSPELAGILQNGWATTREYYESHHDTILRMASVNFRITDFIRKSPEDAAALHMPYLSQISGQTFSTAEGKVIYGSLDPFYSFDEQKQWFSDPNQPLYYANINGAILKTFVTQGVFKKLPPTVEDVIFADDVYRELLQMRADCDALFKKAAPDTASRAKRYYDAFNYLDARRVLRGES